MAPPAHFVTLGPREAETDGGGNLIGCIKDLNRARGERLNETGLGLGESYPLVLAADSATLQPAALIGIFLTSLVVRRLGAELEDDPEYQARIAAGTLDPPSSRRR